MNDEKEYLQMVDEDMTIRQKLSVALVVLALIAVTYVAAVLGCCL